MLLKLDYNQLTQELKNQTQQGLKYIIQYLCAGGR
jgi:hypothetical protein